MKATAQKEAKNPVAQNTNNQSVSLPTPISIENLELALSGHPDRQFVAQDRNNLKHGAKIGFKGSRVPLFAKNLPAALANPNIVSTNLEKEVSLGRVAGPFDSPPMDFA